MACITVYGDEFGDPRYVLVLDHWAFVLDARDASRAMAKTLPFRLPGSMTGKERELAREAWARREGHSEGK